MEEEQESEGERKNRYKRTKSWQFDRYIYIYIYTSSLSNDRDVATHHSGKWSDEKIKFRARLLHKESGRCDFLFVERVF